MKQFSEDVDIFKISKSRTQNLKNFKMLKISKIMFLVFLDGFGKFFFDFFDVFFQIFFSNDFYRSNFVTTPLPAAPQLHRAVSSSVFHSCKALQLRCPPGRPRAARGGGGGVRGRGRARTGRRWRSAQSTPTGVAVRLSSYEKNIGM